MLSRLNSKFNRRSYSNGDQEEYPEISLTSLFQALTLSLVCQCFGRKKVTFGVRSISSLFSHCVLGFVLPVSCLYTCIFQIEALGSLCGLCKKYALRIHLACCKYLLEDDTSIDCTESPQAQVRLHHRCQCSVRWCGILHCIQGKQRQLPVTGLCKTTIRTIHSESLI